MAPYPRPAPGDAYAASRALFDVLITRLSDPRMATRPEHAVEEFIAGTGRDVLRQALQDHLDARAAAERRLPEVTGADEVTRRRAEPGHTRLLSTTLGQVEVTRIAYRHPGVSNLHPADAQLALPESCYSFPLQQAVVHETVTGALRRARDGLDRILGTRIGTRQLMQITTDAARDVRDFYAQRPVPAPAVRPGGAGPRDLLVLSIDATGINMIDSGLRESPPARDDRPRPPSAQLSGRERTGRTRMAVVTAVYDCAAAVRGPADIMPADASERGTRRPGPKAVNRQVDASIVDSTAPMTTRLFDRAEQRDPHHLRRWIVLVDGDNHQIDRINAEAHAHGVRINLILDFVHVLEYLWKAAEDLHPTQPGRAAFVARTALGLLEHHPARVIADLNSHYDAVTATGDTAPGLKRCIDYLTTKRPYLIYQIALTMGWPIATGVIEGTWCATRRTAVSPVQLGRTRREVLGSNGLPAAERPRRGPEHARKPRAGSRRWGRCRGRTRVIWRKLDCLKPNLQSTELRVRRKDVWNRRRVLPQDGRLPGAPFGARDDAQRGYPRR